MTGGGSGGGRHVAQVAAGILFTRVLGYVRERVFAHYFGNGAAADAFRAAFRIPNAIRNLLGEGTLSASFIPVYARLTARPDPAAARALAGAVLGLLLLGAGGMALMGIALAPALAAALAPGFDPETRRLTVALLRILFPMSGFMVVSAWCLGVLNTHRRFFLPYAAPAVWNVAAIAALVGAGTWLVTPDLPVAARMHRLSVALAWGEVLGAVLQIAVQLPACWRLLGGLPAFRPRAEGVRDVVVAWAPLVVGAGVAQISGLVDTVLGSLLGPGGVASLSYAQILQVLPVSLFGVSVAAVALPDLSRDAAAPTPNGTLRARLAVGFRRIAFFVVPAAFAFVALGRILVAALFETGRFGANDTALVARVLAAYGVGLLGAASVKLFASGFYALGDTRRPVAVGIASLGVSTGLAFLLMRRFGAAGIALGSSAGSLLNLAVQMWLLDRRIGAILSGPDWRRLGVVVLGAAGAAGAGLAAVAVARGLGPIPLAAGACAIFGVTYFGVTAALRHPDALRLWQSLRGSLAN